ncbi:PilZ domain-containing protein [Geobacter sp. SVR]|uniref:PilZ domain-containing protein n=1 Tax=Geobacter sp. SVR TaxID=2495594 RepID=UPI00143EF8C6|nr:PilZ domain-containing protein [Geobacter sp. SVR]BCS53381.1 hypothetical protein GSVR_16890 [Geobacter sp. SVR]GCF85493.1 hypothetical protein GSbR_20930 [Geobacter sp. SVR]
MISRRSSERITSTRKCILDHKGKKLACRLEDISASGVLIKCRDIHEEDFQTGEICTIKFDDPQLHQRKFRCSVSRRYAGHLGLQFIFLGQ